ncbi:hypothetical protein FJY84_02140 [Candidatus Bathyarchaeota archaeon]|nr:hypothetical protein [Candidatus Bathyarchaeota archaeon]
MNQPSKHNPYLTKLDEMFLAIVNSAIVIMAVIDLMVITNLYTENLELIAGVNMLVVILAFQSFRIKRRVNKKIREKKSKPS